MIKGIQDRLNFVGVENPQFADRCGLGKVGLAGFCLGAAFGVAACVVCCNLYLYGLQSSLPLQVGLYGAALTLFHFMEFFSTALYKPDTLSYDSFVLNHSEAYTMALLASWLEYAVEAALAPSLKASLGMVALGQALRMSNSAVRCTGLGLVALGQALRVVATCTYMYFNYVGMASSSAVICAGLGLVALGQALRVVAMWTCGRNFNHLIFNSTVICVGLGLVALGQALRVVAMWTCGRNFNHLIMAERDAGHELVTRGVYAVLRHPSYCGWFWWSVGTQVLLGNPLCLAGYTWAGWAFFSERIPYEERLLSQFYPHEYPAYAAHTYVGIPFISNAKLRAAAAAAAAAAAPTAALNGGSSGGGGGGAAATNGVAANGDSRKLR
ncbi:Isoprenylcysteine carboxyl methyltransferase family-domain-containing protein [Tribonema minus]|uniref:Protein-S-isoprenylcysteine O-methyltransferase n=1 Tax=Tribonema minus TaxID=303371 RepID=A0A836CP01_9STRA|nr:Isoprenylcysteine carboxyl methyltransferase family-domain-containing protein [Tribonema minus]